jgi:hypothetical protein
MEYAVLPARWRLKVTTSSAAPARWRVMRIDADGNLFITGRIYERGEKPKGER